MLVTIKLHLQDNRQNEEYAITFSIKLEFSEGETHNHKPGNTLTTILLLKPNIKTSIHF